MRWFILMSGVVLTAYVLSACCELLNCGEYDGLPRCGEGGEGGKGHGPPNKGGGGEGGCVD